MKQLRKIFTLAMAAGCVASQGPGLNAQAPAVSPVAATAPTVVPALVPYTSFAETTDGKAMSGEVNMTFLLFKDETGGEPLWTETQRVAVGVDGQYKVQLGASSASGLPLTVFASGEARWLEVQIAGQKPQARVLLSSVPYAAKAADAATLGGLPASAFMLAGSQATASQPAAVSPDAGTTVTTTGGTSKYLPIFTSASSIADSEIYDTGTSVGIGDKPNASAKLDIAGSMIVRGNTIVSRTGNATSAKGYGSYGFDFFSSIYNSSTKATDNAYYALQSEPSGNNTGSPTATFNLLFGNNGAGATETGLYFNPDGTIHFVPGQTFPGIGGGITGVTAGTALTGGGTSGTVTLNLDTTKVPLLGVSNNFAGTQTITNGIVNLSPTSGSQIGSVYIGGVPFLHGYGSGNKNVWVGGAGNFSTSSSNNAGVGYQALYSQSSGGGNTAVGDVALYATTTGSSNTAVGNTALFSNTSGSDNTAIGAASGPAFGDLALTDTTAVGYGATVAQSNSLVLGQTAGSPGTSYVNVGVGTETPASILELSQSSSGALGPVITLTNPAGQANAAAAIDFNTSTPGYGAGYFPGAEIRAQDAGGYTDNLVFSSNPPGKLNNGSQVNLQIQSTGQVVVGPELPVSQAQLVVFQEENNINAIQAYGATITTGSYAGYGGDGMDVNGGDSTGANDAGVGANISGGNNYSNGRPGDGIYVSVGQGGATPAYAGDFNGDVFVFGNIDNVDVASSSILTTKIDHPLDPTNKYLTLTAVQSPEMTSVYSGNVTTDELGFATVQLPKWFDALNGDFRYQLTTIGRPAQAWVAEEVADHHFRIATNASQVKVSWQITALRQDPYAKAHPLVVEEQKPEMERGFYRNPGLYGQPEEKQLEWARRPELMKKMKAQREAARLRQPHGTKLPASMTAHPLTVPPSPALKPIASVTPLKVNGRP